MNEETIKQVTQLALEYRLSLYYICQILKINPTDENQEKIKNIMMHKLDCKVLGSELEYLFYETTAEVGNNNRHFYNVAYQIWGNLQLAKKSGDRERIENAYQNLYLTDIVVKKLESRKRNYTFTDDDILWLAKYRIKHCLSVRELASKIGAHYQTLYEKFSKIENKYYARKTEIINDYLKDKFRNANYKSKKKSRY